MAEENILSISLKDYKAQIDALKGSLLGLEKESEQYKSTVSQVQSMQDRLNTVLNDCKTTNSAVKGSYNSLTAELANLRSAWKATADEVERSNIGSKMSEINEQLKALDASVGNYQRNVGDYSNQFRAAFSSMGGSIEGTFNSLQSLVSILPNLGSAFTDVGKKLLGMTKANPILLAISVAIGAIVAVCAKFKSAVSKNADLQKRWNANLAAFKPILDMVNKAFNWLAEVIMDCVDWVIDNLPSAFKFISKYINAQLDYLHLLVNAILFIPKTLATAFGQAIKIVAKGAKKIGEGMETVLEFFGMDEAAKKCKDSLNSISESINGFGDDALAAVQRFSDGVDNFFTSAGNSATNFFNDLGKQMAASKKNTKEQQKVAKEEAALEEKLYKDRSQNIKDRIAIKETENAREKELLREARKRRNEELASEAQDLAKRKYLAKQEEYMRNGRALTSAEKAELRQLKENYLKAGQELLQRNEELTLDKGSSKSSKAVVKAATKAAQTVSAEAVNTFAEELKKALKNVNEDDIWNILYEKFTATAPNNIKATNLSKLNNKLFNSKDLAKSIAAEGDVLYSIWEKFAYLSMLPQEDIETIFNDAWSRSITKEGGVIDTKIFLQYFKKSIDNSNMRESLKTLTKDYFEQFFKGCSESSKNIINSKNIDKILDYITGLDINDADFDQWRNGKIYKLSELLTQTRETVLAITAASNGKYQPLFEIMKPVLPKYSDMFKDIESKNSIRELTDQQFAAFIEIYNQNAGKWTEAFTTKNIELQLNIINETEEKIKEVINKRRKKLEDEEDKELKDATNNINDKMLKVKTAIFDDTDRKNWSADNYDLFNNVLSNIDKTAKEEQLKAVMDAASNQLAGLEDLKNKLTGELANVKDMIERGSVLSELKKLDEDIFSAKLANTEAYLNYNKYIYDQEYEIAKKNAEKKKKLQDNWTNTVTQSMQNMGSAMSTYASLRQSIIEQEVKNGEKSQEEAEKEFERTKGVAIAGAITSALANSVSQTYSIWKSEQPLWSKISLTATMVPATLASLFSTINQIKSTDLNSTSTSTPGSASISSVAVTPILDENQDADRIQAMGVKDAITDQKVYILESDIQKSNKRVAVRESNSTF